MSIFKKKSVVAVHNGRFHADDVFAYATLRILLDGDCKIVRTRDEKTIDAAEYVIDVGGIYDGSKKRFDHHQQGGAGIRPNGVPYAAFGLVWKEYGAAISGSASVAERIDKKLVCSIDAGDNGVETYAPISDILFPYTIQAAFGSYMPTWKEPIVTERQFLSAVEIAEGILRREIAQASDFFEAEKQIQKIYDATADKRILILDRMYPWEEIVTRYPEPLFVVASRDGKNWKAEGALVGKGFERRRYFPHAWAGLRDQDLEKASGVPGAVFCHNNRFIVTAKTKEGALALANLALNG